MKTLVRVFIFVLLSSISFYAHGETLTIRAWRYDYPTITDGSYCVASDLWFQVDFSDEDSLEERERITHLLQREFPEELKRLDYHLSLRNENNTMFSATKIHFVISLNRGFTDKEDYLKIEEKVRSAYLEMKRRADVAASLAKKKEKLCSFISDANEEVTNAIFILVKSLKEISL